MPERQVPGSPNRVLRHDGCCWLCCSGYGREIRVSAVPLDVSPIEFVNGPVFDSFVCAKMGAKFVISDLLPM